MPAVTTVRFTIQSAPQQSRFTVREQPAQTARFRIQAGGQTARFTVAVYGQTARFTVAGTAQTARFQVRSNPGQTARFKIRPAAQTARFHIFNMALAATLKLRLALDVVDATARTVSFKDTTGSFDVVDNPFGYGTPNPERGTLQILFGLRPYGTQDYILPDDYNPLWASSWTMPMPKVGLYEGVIIAVPYNAANPAQLSDISFYAMDSGTVKATVPWLHHDGLLDCLNQSILNRQDPARASLIRSLYTSLLENYQLQNYEAVHNHVQRLSNLCQSCLLATNCP